MESTKMMNDGFGKLPGFTAVKQDGLYVSVENPC
jgi:hypothetical protein